MRDLWLSAAIGALGGLVALLLVALTRQAHSEELRAPYCSMLVMVTIDWPCVEAVASGSTWASANDRAFARALLRKGKR